MSAEDTELTFIRCPSCRSLVPAVATRCRMCGHQFSSQDANESSKNKVKQIAEEVEDTPSEREMLYSEPEEKTPASFEAEFEDMVEDDTDDTDEDDSDDDFSSQQSTQNGSEQSTGKRKRRRRRKKKSSDQGFSSTQEAPRAEIPRAEVPRAEAPRAEIPRVEVPKVEQRVEAPKMERTEFISRSEIQAPRSPEPRNFEQPKVEHQRMSKEPAREVTKTMENGALVGWLVNYAQNTNGSSIELRSGKYFVARQRLRDDDLVIPDSAISTPHCLLKAAKGQLHIQDLMSEQGTFVKKQGSASFVPAEEVSSVEHGDRIRFGAFEVVVCLVP
jgi:hypothetical protein